MTESTNRKASPVKNDADITAKKEKWKAYYQAHKEEILEKQKAYKEAHKEAHKEKTKEYQTAYYQAHKGKDEWSNSRIY